jgi:hypothetical protein
LKTSRGLQILLAVVKHLVEGLSLETLLTLKLEKSLTCLVGTRKLTLSIKEQPVLLLQTLIRNKVSRFCCLEESVLKCKYVIYNYKKVGWNKWIITQICRLSFYVFHRIRIW